MQDFVSFFRVAAPFSVARCVMEKSPHSMLVGQGAQDFAATNGFPVESNSALQTQKSREAFEVIIAKGTLILIHPQIELDHHTQSFFLL